MSFIPPRQPDIRITPSALRGLHTLAVAVVMVLLTMRGWGAPETDGNGAQSVETYADVLETGDVHAQQKALTALGAIPGADADRLLLAQLDRYFSGKLPPALWMELLEAAARRTDPAIKNRLAEHQQKVTASRDPLTPYRECLEGGDADAGREIFTKKVEAGCIRCHRVNGEGGEIGPDLSAIHQVSDRLYILESIVDPNAVIAAGFQNVLLTLKSGDTVWGIASFESENEIVLTSVIDGKKHTYAIADIVDRQPLPSAMPPGFGIILGKRAVRDLVEFLATNRAPTD